MRQTNEDDIFRITVIFHGPTTTSTNLPRFMSRDLSRNWRLGPVEIACADHHGIFGSRSSQFHPPKNVIHSKWAFKTSVSSSKTRFLRGCSHLFIWICSLWNCASCISMMFFGVQIHPEFWGLNVGLFGDATWNIPTFQDAFCVG